MKTKSTKTIEVRARTTLFKDASQILCTSVVFVFQFLFSAFLAVLFVCICMCIYENVYVCAYIWGLGDFNTHSVQYYANMQLFFVLFEYLFSFRRILHTMHALFFLFCFLLLLLLQMLFLVLLFQFVQMVSNMGTKRNLITKKTRYISFFSIRWLSTFAVGIFFFVFFIVFQFFLKK